MKTVSSGERLKENVLFKGGGREFEGEPVGRERLRSIKGGY